MDRAGVVFGMANCKWLAGLVLVLGGCGSDFGTAAEQENSTGGTASTATGGAIAAESGAPAIGGSVATGGASVVATGGNVATGGTTAGAGGNVAAAGSVTVPSCLLVMRNSCTLCGKAWTYETDVAGWVASCREVIDCWLANNCGPDDACSKTGGACLAKATASSLDIATDTYRCSCAD